MFVCHTYESWKRDFTITDSNGNTVYTGSVRSSIAWCGTPNGADGVRIDQAIGNTVYLPLDLSDGNGANISLSNYYLNLGEIDWVNSIDPLTVVDSSTGVVATRDTVNGIYTLKDANGTDLFTSGSAPGHQSTVYQGWGTPTDSDSFQDILQAPRYP